jgi:hypothetical protein
MREISTAVSATLTSAAVLGQVVSFAAEPAGAAPEGWRCGVTGTGNPHWSVAADPSAPDQRKVLIQSGKGTFPWCVKPDASLEDGFVEVMFKPISGREDQAGGSDAGRQALH